VPMRALDFGKFPELLDVPFVAEARGEVPETIEERDARAVLLRVHHNDVVEVGERYAQREERGRAVARGHTVGRIDASGDYVPA